MGRTHGTNPADPLFKPTCSECLILVECSSIKTHNNHTAFNRSPCFLCRSLLIFIRQYQPSINQFVYYAATGIWAMKQASSQVSVLQLSCKNVPAASVDSAENLIHCEFYVLGGMTAHQHFNVWHPGFACRPRLQSDHQLVKGDRQVTCLWIEEHKRRMSEGLESLSDFIGADLKPLSLVTLLWWGNF